MTTNEVAVRHAPGSVLAILPDQQEFTDAQVSVLRQLGVKDATRGDLAIFFHQATRTGLDPFARQIYMIGRKTTEPDGTKATKQTIQTGIDGFRLIARRAADKAGDHLGYEDTAWCGDDGAWVDVWLEDTPPVAARVVVKRGEGRYPAVARWKAYVQTKYDGKPNAMWARMDAEQLEKCAEAKALRKAFPQDLSGVYIDDEMAQADLRPRRRGAPDSSLNERIPDATVDADAEPDPSAGAGDE